MRFRAETNILLDFLMRGRMCVILGIGSKSQGAK